MWPLAELCASLPTVGLRSASEPHGAALRSLGGKQVGGLRGAERSWRVPTEPAEAMEAAWGLEDR